MNDVINFIFELRSKGHNITFELNKFGIFTVVEHYNESVNGRMIYGAKKNELWSGRVDEVGEWLCDDLEAKMMGNVAECLR
jgi:hypothetical protein